MEKLSTREVHSFVYYVGLQPKNNYLLCQGQQMDKNHHWLTETKADARGENYVVAFDKRRLILKVHRSFFGFGSFDKRKFITHLFWQDLENLQLIENAHNYRLQFSWRDAEYQLRIAKDENSEETVSELLRCCRKFIKK